MENRNTYKFLSKIYDLFDLIFIFGGKGNPRPGLLYAISDHPFHILDVCMGTGASSLLVASHNPQNQIMGIDISDEMLAVAQRKIEQKKLTIPTGTRPQQVLNLLNKLGRVKWNVCIQERYAHGKGVLTYLGRYMRGGPISNRRIISWTKEKVRIRYKDYREDESSGKKHKELELSTDEFLRRLLLHVPKPGSKVVRSYGLYAGCRRDDLNLCREMLDQEPVQEVKVRDWQDCVSKFGDKDPSRCPICGARMLLREVIAPLFKGMTMKFPLLESA
jgi:hypothetical protein